jgi:hypothetical protein
MQDSNISLKPFCPKCGDLYYIKDRKGHAHVCPACSCPKCARLKNVHPDLGGCTCNIPNPPLTDAEYRILNLVSKTFTGFEDGNIIDTRPMLLDFQKRGYVVLTRTDGSRRWKITDKGRNALACTLPPALIAFNKKVSQS